MRPLSMFAQTQPGLEHLVLQEILALGTGVISPKVVKGGVKFSGHSSVLYGANLNVRCASRILVRIGSFRARAETEYVNKLKRLALEQFAIEKGTLFETNVSTRSCRLFHSGMLKNLTRTALGNYSISGDHVNTQKLIVTGEHDKFTVSIDSSGDHLHKRFYRQNEIVKMPIRETLAASFLYALGFQNKPDIDFLDPFCGSGTLAIEAALIASDTAPGLVRIRNLKGSAYAFQNWPAYQKDRFEEQVEIAQAKVKLPGKIQRIRGSDRDDGIVKTAKICSEKAGVADWVSFDNCSFMNADYAMRGKGLIFTNPPWGIRSQAGKKDKLRNLYSAFGDCIRTKAENCRLSVIVPKTYDAKNVLWATGLSWKKVHVPVKSGGTSIQLWESNI